MTMIEFLSLASALLAGVVLGALFFGGLWWTIRRGLSSTQPALWFVGSMLLRTGMAAAGFYFVLGDSWQRLLAGLAGFVIARLAAMRLARTRSQCGLLTRESGHAP